MNIYYDECIEYLEIIYNNQTYCKHQREDGLCKVLHIECPCIRRVETEEEDWEEY